MNQSEFDPMLLSGWAKTRRQVWDITEEVPIPRWATVSIQDYDSCAELFFVEWQDRIYTADLDDLQ